MTSSYTDSTELVIYTLYKPDYLINVSVVHGMYVYIILYIMHANCVGGDVSALVLCVCRTTVHIMFWSSYRV